MRTFLLHVKLIKYKIVILHLKKAIGDINELDIGFSRKLDSAEERISKLKDASEENDQSKEWIKKRCKIQKQA